MSRCIICNVILSEQELKHKDTTTGQYSCMCTDCYGEHESLVNEIETETLVLYHTQDTERFNGLTSDDLV
jgi:hypothetical protein